MKNTIPTHCENCGSDNMNFVRFIMKNGRNQLRVQCFDCGLMPSMNYKHKEVPDISEVPLCNDELRDKFHDRVKKRSQLKKDMFENGDSYYRDIYLNSEEWKRKRKRIISRDQGKCVICDKVDNLNVHHITYRNVFKEPKEHLITLCRDCHSDVHSDAPVFKNGLMYNYGKLNVCQNCKELNNNGNLLLCDECSVFSYTDEESTGIWRKIVSELRLEGLINVSNELIKADVIVDYHKAIRISFEDKNSMKYAVAREDYIFNRFREITGIGSLIIKIDYSFVAKKLTK